MTIRPMVPEDQDALLDFFRSIPPEDRFSLKDNVTDPTIIARWAQTLDYSRVLPLLAFLDGTIVGDGTLHHRHAGRASISEKSGWWWPRPIVTAGWAGVCCTSSSILRVTKG
jgi:hypothetical protein